MDAFPVLHTDRTKCSGLIRDQRSPTQNGFLIIKLLRIYVSILQGDTSVLLSTNSNVFTEARGSFFNPQNLFLG